MKLNSRRVRFGFNVRSLSFKTILIAAATLTPSFAVAGDWSLDANFAERFSFDDNIQQSVDSPGVVFGSSTTWQTNLRRRSATSAFSLTSDLQGRLFVGPGDTDDLDSFNQSYSTDYSKTYKNLTLTSGGLFSIQNTTFSEFEETGVLSEGSTSRITLSGSGGASYSINRRSGVSLSSSVSLVDFTEDSVALTPIFSADVSTSFDHKINSRFDFSVSGVWNYFSADNATDTTSNTFGLDAELSARLTQRLTAGLLLGASAVTTESTDAVLTTTSSDTSIVRRSRLSLDYQLQTTQFSLSVGRTTRPSALGEIQQSDNLTLAFSRQVNSRSSLGLNINGGRQNSISGTLDTDRTFITVSPVYSYRLTKELSASMGYNFRLQDTNSISTTSNSLFLSLSRPVSLIR